MSFFNTKVVLKFLFATLLSLSLSTINAQCFEIESILVDACGNPEGENEMVRFKVGSTALNTANISVNWPNNSYQGICQNAITSSVVTTLNATILSCGFLLEPTGGVLPANSNVLLITSTAVDVSANSFANLSDTLFVIFQCVGNIAGHFANYNTSPGLRTLSISFSAPIGCTDTVTYDRTLLVNQNGTSGGTTALKNGALANFDPAGNVTYANQGCQAPFNPTSITADSLSSLTICPGDSINLVSTTLGAIQSIFWIGNFGSFSNPTNDTTTYFSSLNDTLPFEIIVGGISACNDTIYDTLMVNVTPTVNIFITGSDTLDLCQGQSLPLTANGAPNYLWNTGSSSSSINVTNGGMFLVVGNNTCFSDSDSVFVNLIPQINVFITEPSPISLCAGDSIVLHATGDSNYVWSTGANNIDSIMVNSAGSFNVSSTNSCFTDTAFVQVNLISQINVNITEPDTVSICTGDSIALHATGGSNYNWSIGSAMDSIVINSSGYYFVTSSNSCFNDSAFIQVNISPLLNVSIIETDTITLCQGDSTTLHVTGTSSFLWSTSETTDSIIVNSQGYYSVSANGNCPSNLDSIFVEIQTPNNTIITEGNPIILCSGNSITLHASGGTNYSWNTGATSDSIVVNTIGQYYVSSSNGVCPSSFDTTNIINDISPSALIIGDSVLCIGESLALTANGNGSYSWSTGSNGSSTTIFSAQQIILTSTNSCNDFISDTLNVTEEDCSIITNAIIPNVLTPNKDNSNDLFKIIGTNIVSMTGAIYNRWGNLLFEWDDINTGWDGTFEGEIVPEGTYFYILEITFIDNKSENFTGTVLLLK